MRDTNLLFSDTQNDFILHLLCLSKKMLRSIINAKSGCARVLLSHKIYFNIQEMENISSLHYEHNRQGK